MLAPRVLGPMAKIGAKILELQARMSNDLALSLGRNEKDRKVELLGDARSIYKGLLSRYAGANESVARISYALAVVEEQGQALMRAA